MNKMSIVNKFFQHRNGNYYYVLNNSIHTETGEKLVNYMSLYSTEKFPFGSIWSRPLSMWNEIVEGKPRFVQSNPPTEIMDQFRKFMLIDNYETKFIKK